MMRVRGTPLAFRALCERDDLRAACSPVVLPWREPMAQRRLRASLSMRRALLSIGCRAVLRLCLRITPFADAPVLL